MARDQHDASEAGGAIDGVEDHLRQPLVREVEVARAGFAGIGVARAGGGPGERVGDGKRVLLRDVLAGVRGATRNRNRRLPARRDPASAGRRGKSGARASASTRLAGIRRVAAPRLPEAIPWSRPGRPARVRNSAVRAGRSRCADRAARRCAIRRAVAGALRRVNGARVWSPSKSRPPAASRCESFYAPAPQFQRLESNMPVCARRSGRAPRSPRFFRDAPR